MGRGRQAAVRVAGAPQHEPALDVPAVRAAYEAVDALAVAGRWARPATPQGANELDQLAVDPSGRLVLVELKDARSNEVVTAPLQALRYAWEWHGALAAVLPSLRRLLAARRRVGLVPDGTPDLTGELRTVVAWADGSPSAEVLRRMRAVKEVVDAHLPAGVGEVEVWAMPGGVPARVA